MGTFKGNRLTRSTLALDKALQELAGVSAPDVATLQEITKRVLEAADEVTCIEWDDEIAAMQAPKIPELVGKHPRDIRPGDMKWSDGNRFFLRVASRAEYTTADAWEWDYENGSYGIASPYTTVTVAADPAAARRWNADVNLGAIDPFKAVHTERGSAA